LGIEGRLLDELALGIKVTRKEDLKASMKEILGHDGTALLEIVTDGNLL